MRKHGFLLYTKDFPLKEIRFSPSSRSGYRPPFLKILRPAKGETRLTWAGA
jgi:hypothetical protein